MTLDTKHEVNLYSMRKTKWPLVSYPNTSISTNTTYPNWKPQQTAKSCDPKLINHSKIGQFLAILWQFLHKKLDFALAQPNLNLQY